MFKQYIQKWKFKNKIYEVFLNELHKTFKNNRAIFLFEIEDDFFKINVLLDNKYMLFTKYKNEKITYIEYILSKEIENLSPELNNTPEFHKLVLKFKENGEAIESSHIVEYTNTKIKTFISYYHLERQEVAFIYEKLISDHLYFYQFNHGSTILEGSANKWLD